MSDIKIWLTIQNDIYDSNKSRKPRFNPYPNHPLDRPPQRRPRETRRVQPRMGPQSTHAQTAPTDTLRQEPGEALKAQPIPQTHLWISRESPHRGLLQPDEEENRRRGLPHHRGMAPKGGAQAEGLPAADGRARHNHQKDDHTSMTEV